MTMKEYIKLLPHQQQALDRTEGFSAVAYYHDMGLGKTFLGAEKLHRYNDKRALVVCQKSKVTDWLVHFQTYYDYKVYDFSKNIDVNFTGVAVINYDLLIRRPQILQIRDFTLLLDESSMIQNDTAKRTKIVLKMKPNHIILLSGTPVGGKYENLYSQLRLLGVDMKKSEYYDKFIITRMMNIFVGGFSRMIRTVCGYKNIDQLNTLLKQHGADFVKTEEVLTLPEQRFIPVYTDYDSHYTELSEDRYTVLDDREMIADTPLKALLYMRVVCACCESRLNTLRDLFSSTSKRIVVFYNFTHELELISAMCKPRPYSVINGKSKDLTSFMNNDDGVVFVQYQSGAMGLNLQIADIIIYSSLPLSSELYEQSKKRIHRVGQRNTCIYYVLKCRNSIEDHIEKTLNMRKDYTDKLFEEYYERKAI